MEPKDKLRGVEKVAFEWIVGYLPNRIQTGCLFANSVHTVSAATGGLVQMI